MARTRQLARIQTSDPALNRLQDQWLEVLNPLLRASGVITDSNVLNTVPKDVGLLAVTGGHVYISAGTVAASDWKKVD